MKLISKYALVTGLFVAGAVTASLADDPVKQRQELMKSVGEATKTAAQMVKGQAPFDSAKAVEAMQTINAVPDKYVTLFPEGSDKGDTEASPKIWEDMEGFKASAEKLKSASAAAAEAAKQSEGAFKAAFGALVQNCSSCHKAYRIKKE